MKIAILSFYSGVHDRGVETWAANLQRHVGGINIFSGWKSYNPLLWLKYDIVIPTNGRFQVLLARLFCKRIIVFGHSGPGADDKWNLLCSPDVFVAFSQAQSSWARRFKWPWTKIEVIHHAVDISAFTPTHPQGDTVLCVAANEPAKRVELIKAVPGIKLRVVGRGQPEEVPYYRMPEIYHQARVFCFVPQPWEAFGLVFLEALASNLPVVTIDDLIRREIVGDAGIFVKNPEDSHSLAVAIGRAISTDWGDKPRRQAAKFSWDKVAKLYDLCFHNCLK